jgi:tRNA pseudouridine(38-40) synthase
MPRYALMIEYDGAPFAGWQRQADQPSVQGALEAALATLEPDVPSVAAAGRTDAGVHATGQVAQADLARDWDPFRLAEALNWHLKPAPVAVVACAEVSGDWHARFSAIERRYSYRVISRRAPLVEAAGGPGICAIPLEVAPMREGAAHLLGTPRFHHVPRLHLPGEEPGQDARQDRDRGGLARPWAWSAVPPRGAVVPAQPGALHRGHAGAGRRRGLGTGRAWPRRWRPATARPAGRSRRPTGCA